MKTEREFFRRRAHCQPFGERARRALHLTLKSAVIVALPLPLVAVIDTLWYRVCFVGKLHFSDQAEGSITAGLIPTLGLFFGFFATMMLSTAWSEYKKIRIAVKRNDKDAFADLCDEQISPLVHVLMGVLASFLLGSFMLLHYREVFTGLFCVSTCTYLTAIYFLVLTQIDDPCTGLWFIRSIPQEWLEMDVKAYREKRILQKRGHI